jgi:predicted Zn finger-like uncharacterized protein
MLIVCPNCATSYDIDTATLRPGGRKVRCVRCRTVWQAEISHADKLIAAAQALAPVRRAVEAVAEAVGAERSAPPTAAWSEETPAAAADAARQAPEGRDADFAADADSDLEVTSPPIAPDLEADADHIAEDTEADVVSAKPFDDVETVAARRTPRRSRGRAWRWPLSRLQAGILGLIVLDAIVVGWRADFVRALPQTASFYAALGMPVNLRGLVFDALVTSTEQHEGVPILVVEGNIVNVTGKIADVPHLRFAVRNAARQEIYSWTAVPARTTLPPGQAVAFRSRLASPPPDAHDVLVRFVNRYDVFMGVR